MESRRSKVLIHVVIRWAQQITALFGAAGARAVAQSDGGDITSDAGASPAPGAGACVRSISQVPGSTRPPMGIAELRVGRQDRASSKAGQPRAVPGARVHERPARQTTAVPSRLRGKIPSIASTLGRHTASCQAPIPASPFPSPLGRNSVRGLIRSSVPLFRFQGMWSPVRKKDAVT